MAAAKSEFSLIPKNMAVKITSRIIKSNNFVNLFIQLSKNVYLRMFWLAKGLQNFD